jgi:restriction endonuclease S subunit
MNDIDIILPPLERQNRVVEIIAKLDKARESLINIVNDLKEIHKQSFYLIMSKKKNKVIKKLYDMCEMNLGFTPSTENKDNFIGNNIWVSISDMNDENIYIKDSVKKLSNKAIKINKLNKKGTVLLSFKLSIGKVKICDCDLYTNEAIFGLNSIDKNIMTNEYLAYYLKNTNITEDARGIISKGSLNTSSVSTLDIILPSLEDQLDIVRQYEEANNEYNNSMAFFNSQIEKIDMEIKSMLS